MTRMELTSAFLANYAEVRGGVLTAVGAYPEWWDLPIIPGAATIFLVAILDIREAELGQPFWFNFAIRRPDSASDEPIGVVQALREQPNDEEEIPRGVQLRNTIVVGANAVIGTPGLHEFVLTEMVGTQSIRVAVWIRHRPQAQPQLPGI